MNDTNTIPSLQKSASMAVLSIMTVVSSSAVYAQSVCLPAPRLLTMMPMGGQVGTHVEIRMTGEHLDDADESFSRMTWTCVPVYI